jgi:uncharacterized protein (DUF169 family)
MGDYDISKNNEYAKILQDKLGLDSKIVAIKFYDNESEIPEGIEKITTPVRHCEMVKKASQGEAFYATKDEEACKGGSAALGLEDAPEKVASGAKYFELGRFKSLEDGKKVADDLTKVSTRHAGIIYQPLEDAQFAPDVIIYFGKPISGMRTAQAYVYEYAEKFLPSFSGIQSLCGDACATPIETGKPNATLGCDGSRKAAKVKDEELAVGINQSEIPNIAEAVDKIL